MLKYATAVMKSIKIYVCHDTDFFLPKERPWLALWCHSELTDLALYGVSSQ